jgi:hypothetical protein
MERPRSGRTPVLASVAHTPIVPRITLAAANSLNRSNFLMATSFVS